VLFISLKAENVLSHDHLHRVDSGRVLSKLSLEIGFEALTIGLSKVYGRGYVEVMQEIGDVEENGMAGLVNWSGLGRV
jgi:hypothetical protein